VREETKRLKISRTRVVCHNSAQPGTILNGSKGNLVIATGDQALELLEVQLEGKKSMSSAELIRGIPSHQLIFNVVI
jgi:methionyl-tRNA formyltransferase